LDKLEFCVGYALSATPFKQKCSLDRLHELTPSAIIAHLCAPVPKYGVAKNSDELIFSPADLIIAVLPVSTIPPLYNILVPVVVHWLERKLLIEVVFVLIKPNNDVLVKFKFVICVV